MKELVTVLSLIGVGLWVVQEGTPWLYRMAIMSGNPSEFSPDPRFVGFDVDGPITKQEIQRYREIYFNSRWAQNELAVRIGSNEVPLGDQRRSRHSQPSSLIALTSNPRERRASPADFCSPSSSSVSKAARNSCSALWGRSLPSASAAAARTRFLGSD